MRHSGANASAKCKARFKEIAANGRVLDAPCIWYDSDFPERYRRFEHIYFNIIGSYLYPKERKSLLPDHHLPPTKDKEFSSRFNFPVLSIQIKMIFNISTHQDVTPNQSNGMIKHFHSSAIT